LALAPRPPGSGRCEGRSANGAATGHAGTGQVNANPSNKAPKGISTADAISVNQQQLELPLPVPDMPHVRGEEGLLTWFLLLHRAADEIRGELSLPSALSRILGKAPYPRASRLAQLRDGPVAPCPSSRFSQLAPPARRRAQAAAGAPRSPAIASLTTNPYSPGRSRANIKPSSR
jgi:hypothetical protein